MTVTNDVNLEYYKSTYGSDFAVGKSFVERQEQERLYRGATITWQNVDVFAAERQQSFQFFKRQNKSKKQILNNVNGIAKPGELLAIMGSSGSGKTTLLNVLNCRNKGKLSISGEIKVNGEIIRSSEDLSSITGYVQQEDLFLETLTVKEHLIFQSMLRMDKNIKYDERMSRVNEVMNQLNLKKCQNTVIGNSLVGNKGISGGEMKRLSFASELITNVELLFVDEATSGLDSYMALNVVECMRQLTEKGKTIICTIHQPSSEIFEMFDNLCLMAQGRMAYIGSSKEAENFFANQSLMCPMNYNPAEFYIDKLAIKPANKEKCIEAVNAICDNFEISPYKNNLIREITEHNAVQLNATKTPEKEKQPSIYRSGYMNEIRWLLWRSWINVKRSRQMTKVRTMQTMFFGILFGLIYFQQTLDQDSVQSINGALYQCFVANISYENMIAGILAFTIDTPVFLREHTNGLYRCLTYYITKIIAELPLNILVHIVYTAIVYYLSNFDNDVGKFFICCSIVILVVINSIAFGFMLTALLPNPSAAILIGVALMIPLTAFAGFFLNYNSVADYFVWIRYLSWLSYGTESLFINQWNGIENIQCKNTTISSLCLNNNGADVLNYYAMDKNNLGFDLGLLVAYYVVVNIFGYFALILKAITYANN